MIVLVLISESIEWSLDAAKCSWMPYCCQHWLTGQKELCWFNNDYLLGLFVFADKQQAKGVKFTKKVVR